MRKLSIAFLLLVVFFMPIFPVYAQSQSNLPIYIVQSGDTLGTIAQRFGVPLSTLIEVNAISDPNNISVGMELKIPGLEGISGTLITQPVPLGETFASMAIQYQASTALLARLNRVTSPQELYAGASLVLPEDKEKGTVQAHAMLENGQSVLEVSAGINENPWTSILLKNENSVIKQIPGEIFYSKNLDEQQVSSISPSISSIEINPIPLVQGKTIVVRVHTIKPLTLSGELDGKELHFFEEKDNVYTALQGVYALANPGLTNFTLTGETETGARFSFEEMIIMKAGFYPNDPPLTVDPATIDPAVTKPEEDLIAKVVSPATPTKYWNGIFTTPVDQPIFKSTFGNRRSYNGGPYNSFHGGTDLVSNANSNIYAAADGVVVFAGPLTVRGNATIIDHGWGVYSGYWHQKEIKVKVGDQVKAGQLIGLIGATGRVTGPHLHFEMIVNGIQVEPVDWLSQVYP
jgi:murein DD-endopeptidase MepM/ murein hydrolase activator NlpD